MAKKVKINEGISFSKTRSDWICSWCEHPIIKGEETLIFHALDKWSDGMIYTKGFGSRIHLDCIEPMCKSIMNAKYNKEKYAILNNLDDKKLK